MGGRAGTHTRVSTLAALYLSYTAAARVRALGALEPRNATGRGPKATALRLSLSAAGFRAR